MQLGGEGGSVLRLLKWLGRPSPPFLAQETRGRSYNAAFLTCWIDSAGFQTQRGRRLLLKRDALQALGLAVATTHGTHIAQTSRIHQRLMIRTSHMTPPMLVLCRVRALPGRSYITGTWRRRSVLPGYSAFLASRFTLYWLTRTTCGLDPHPLREVVSAS